MGWLKRYKKDHPTTPLETIEYRDGGDIPIFPGEEDEVEVVKADARFNLDTMKLEISHVEGE